MPAEPILDAALPIIDPHHHLWTEAHGMGRYMEPELLADLGDGHNIVAHADLMLGADVAAVLEAHQSAAPKRFRGIRHMTAWDPDPTLNFEAVGAVRGIMENSRFRAGFTQLQRFGLTFDAWGYHTQLDEFEALARAFSDTTIVLDHTGTPLGVGRFAATRSAVFADWQRSMRKIALCPNVIVKLGGLGMHFCAPQWVGDDERPLSERITASTRDYYLYAIDAFTPGLFAVTQKPG